LHFITFATVHWVDVLSRPLYKDVIVDPMKYCQKEKKAAVAKKHEHLAG
jgi:hypothetical protein